MPASSEYIARKQRQDSLADSEIGEPNLTAAERRMGDRLRKYCREDLLLFNSECFPNSTGLKPFGEKQIHSIRQSQHAVMHGGRVQKLEPRGFTKTTRVSHCALWAVLFSYRLFVPVFAAAKPKAENIVKSWRTELTDNDLLYWMFPELIWPIRCMDDRHTRAAHQTYRYEKTRIVWKNDMLVLPTIKGKSGGVLAARPVGNARGLNHPAPNGEVLRPDFVILDDVQTDDIAVSPPSVNRLANTIRKSILRLGGHSKRLSAINNATPIANGDLTEVLAKDGWSTLRYKMLESRSVNEKLWLGDPDDKDAECYARILKDYSDGDSEGQLQAAINALEFYKANREKMDEGAVANWDWAYEWDDEPQVEISAIQHAYNILILEGPDVFASECQTAPQEMNVASAKLMSVSEIQNKLSGYDEFVLPQYAEKLVAHIDVQGSVLFYAMMAASKSMQVAVTHNGMWPPQPNPYYQSLGDLHMPFDRAYPGLQEEEQIYQALGDLLDFLCEQTSWVREDGAVFMPDLILPDAGYKYDTVRRFCRESKYRSLLKPCLGVGVGAKKKPMSEWPIKQGETKGHHYQIKLLANPPQLCVNVDTNYWKTKVHDLLRAGLGSSSFLALYNATPAKHQMLAEHCRAEYPKLMEYDTRKVEEWSLMPGASRNDHFDNLVNGLAGLSECGCRLPKGGEHVTTTERRRVSFRKKRAG